MREIEYYFKIYLTDIDKAHGDLELLAWYSALKNYKKRFGCDKKGFTRVPSSAFEEDFGLNRVKAWRLNKKLTQLGLIALDASRGGRTWVGFKIVK